MKRTKNLITALLVVTLGATTFVLTQKVIDAKVEKKLNEYKQTVNIDKNPNEEMVAETPVKELPESSTLENAEKMTDSTKSLDLEKELAVSQEEPEEKAETPKEAEPVKTAAPKAPEQVKTPEAPKQEAKPAETVPEPIVEATPEPVVVTPTPEEPAKSTFSSYEEKLPNVPSLTINYAYSFDAALENEILRQLNVYRKENGLNELQMDETLRKISRWKSNSQIQNNYFGHNDVNHGFTPDIIDYRMDGINEYYSALAENLHFTTRVSTSASSIVEAWKKSPGHNQNMLEPWWTHVGIGVAKSSSSGSAFHNQSALLSTQVFGSK